MTQPFPEFDELRGLLDALCEESASAVQIARLEELLLQQPQAEAYYVQFMSLHADLVRHFGALSTRTQESLRQHTAAARPCSAETQPARRRRFGHTALVLTGLAAAIVVAVALLKIPIPRSLPVDPPSEANDESVAVLLQVREADWDESEYPVRPGAALRPGWLRLKSGIAHLEFYSGATVILEGPAEFQLISRTEAYCARGTLRATVPPQAQGFVIGAPSLDLVDRGTEFGLQVRDGKRAEVHVFKGNVDLYDPASGRAPAARKEVRTGQGVRVDGPGVFQPIDISPAAFKTAQDLAKQLQEDTSRRQQEWHTQSAALRRDPAVLVYYPFESAEAWNRTLTDAAGERRQPHDGAIVGCTWMAGRWPGKQALEFKRISDRVRINVAGEFDTLTFMTWVRIDALPNRFNSLFMTDSWEEFRPHWHINNEGVIELGVQGRGRRNGMHYLTEPVITEDRLGQWTHLAVVFDRPNDHVTHYVNGRPVHQDALKLDAPLRLGDGEIGNWNTTTRKHSNPIRYFSGCMDEFILFARALTDAEVERLWTQGRPPS
jgi:hypothetical protein